MESDQQLRNTVETLKSRGLSFAQARKAIEEVLCLLYMPGLSSLQMNALSFPQGRTAVEIIEKLECTCLNEINELDEIDGGFTHFNSDAKGRKRTNNVMYMDDYECDVFFDAVSDKSFMLNMTNHNAGYDLIRFCDWDPDAMTASAILVQQKIGNTPLNNAKTEANANRSATFICAKLKDAAKALRKKVALSFGVTLNITLQIHTTSGVNPAARREFNKNDVELFDATDLWDYVWTPDVKSALVSLYGKQKARGFGRIL